MSRLDQVDRRLWALERELIAGGKIVEDLCDRVKSLEECGKVVSTTEGREATARAARLINPDGPEGPFGPWTDEEVV